MPRSILLVDDSATMRMLLRVYLMGGQYEFHEAASAAEGLDLLSARMFDLVISDVRMEPIDGMMFTRALRKRESGSTRTPVVLISSDTADDMRTRAALAGADAFLGKPLDGDQLVFWVTKLVRSAESDEAITTRSDPSARQTPAHGSTPPAVPKSVPRSTPENGNTKRPADQAPPRRVSHPSLARIDAPPSELSEDEYRRKPK